MRRRSTAILGALVALLLLVSAVDAATSGVINGKALQVAVYLFGTSGTDGQVWTRDSSLPAKGKWADAAAGGGGGLVLVEEHTASSSATLDFTSCISSTYDDYLVRLINLTPATNNVSLYLRVSTDGGSTFDSSSNYYWFYEGPTLLGSTGNKAGNPSTFAQITNNAANTRDGITGTLHISNPLQSTTYHTLRWSDVTTTYNDGNVGTVDGALLWFLTSAVNAFRFYMSSGNITSGTIRCYGIEH